MCIGTGALVWADTEGPERQIAFDIPQQEADAALTAFAEQADLTLIFPPELVEDITASQLIGSYTAEEGAAILLAGTGLTPTFSNPVVLSISADSESANGGESVETKKRAGIMAALASVFAVGVNAQESAGSNDGEQQTRTLVEIIVTGTNIRGLNNPTTPILEFSREDIELSGAATVGDFLRTVPQNFGSTTDNAFNSSSPFGENVSGSTTVDLRGVGAGATLILLNGRRLAPTSRGLFADVSTLPLGAIERVDILTDGASTIYGSDAVAGVVNFVTATNFEGIEARARYGAVTNGELDEAQFGITAGNNWDTGGVLVSADYTDREALLASDRGFVDQAVLANPDASLIPASEAVSVYGALNQSLTERLSLNVDILYGERELTTDSAFAVLTARNTLESIAVNSRLDYELSEDVIISLFYDYSETDDIQTDSRDGFRTEASRGNSISTVEGLISGRIFDLPGGPVSIATGALYREEENSAGSSTGSREVTALYGEALIPLVGASNSLPLVDRFEISLSGRYEDYSDFGDTFNPKIGVFWALNDQFSLRGSYSESFRAPQLSNQILDEQVLFFASPASLVTATTPPEPNPRLPDGSIGYLLINNGSELSEETAEILTAGFEYSPRFSNGFRIEGTYFNIDYRDRIEFVDALPILQNEIYSDLLAINPDLGFVASQIARQNEDGLRFDYFLPIPIEDIQPEDISVLLFTGQQNLSKRQVEGLDLVVSYERESATGNISTSLNATYLTDYKVAATESQPLSQEVDRLYRPIDLRLRGTVGWEYNAFTAFTAVNYSDSYEDFNENKIDSLTTVDLSLVYRPGGENQSWLLDNSQISLNVQNLLDQEPPSVVTLEGYNFDAVNATPLKRFISLQVRKAF